MTLLGIDVNKWIGLIYKIGVGEHNLYYSLFLVCTVMTLDDGLNH